MTTGVVEIQRVKRVSESIPDAQSAAQAEAQAHLEHGFTAVRAGNLTAARAAFEHFLLLAPNDAAAGKARSALEAVKRLMTAMETNGNG